MDHDASTSRPEQGAAGGLIVSHCIFLSLVSDRFRGAEVLRTGLRGN
jgi:hypothetical protein